jgi:hypothetical protein
VSAQFFPKARGVEALDLVDNPIRGSLLEGLCSIHPHHAGGKLRLELAGRMASLDCFSRYKGASGSAYFDPLQTINLTLSFDD